jgi:hypothetical protein
VRHVKNASIFRFGTLLAINAAKEIRMRNLRTVVYSGLVAGSLIASTGFAADRNWLDDLKDRIGDSQDRRDRDSSDRDRSDRDRDRDRDRRDRSGREARISGTVTYVDKEHQAFSIREKDNESVTIIVPSDVSRRDKERFAKLRKGDSVRVAGRFERDNRFTLESFR